MKFLLPLILLLETARSQEELFLLGRGSYTKSDFPLCTGNNFAMEVGRHMDDTYSSKGLNAAYTVTISPGS